MRSVPGGQVLKPATAFAAPWRQFPLLARGDPGEMFLKPLVDSTLSAAREGYGWLPNRRRGAGRPMVQVRLLGQRVTGLCGPDAARMFYDEANIRRATAVPGPVQSTLFGHGAVHTLDGEQHRGRKAFFLDQLAQPRLPALVEATLAAWDDALCRWTKQDAVVLFEGAGQVLTTGVCRWAGVPLPPADVPWL